MHSFFAGKLGDKFSAPHNADPQTVSHLMAAAKQRKMTRPKTGKVNKEKVVKLVLQDLENGIPLNSALKKMRPRASPCENPYAETPSPKRKMTRSVSQNSLGGKVKNGAVDRPLSAVRASLEAKVFKRNQSASKIAQKPDF